MPHEPMPPLEVGDWVMIQRGKSCLDVVAYIYEQDSYPHDNMAVGRRFTFGWSQVLEIRKPSGLVWRRAEPTP